MQLEWRGSTTALEVEIGPEGDLAYLLIGRREGRREAEEAQGQSRERILELIARVVAE